uniref:PDZ domain-containing protein n=1 Tax=Parastrongyloides trichosuri TaxID=131310 RepID=A0A0N4ZTU6_PARTI
MMQNIKIKSKFDFEYRRFSINVPRDLSFTFELFCDILQRRHDLKNIPISIIYINKNGDSLPINNENNMRKAFENDKNVLKIFISRKQDLWSEHINENNVMMRKKKSVTNILNVTNKNRKSVLISQPMDFRRISAIIDVNTVPEQQRRVHLCKQEGDSNLGFYIKTTSVFRVTHNGIVRTNGIFISRLVCGGLTESTGLLAPNDEILEVNGISVENKSLDQVADIMVANSFNLILTIKPCTPIPMSTKNSLKRRDVYSMYEGGNYNSTFKFDVSQIFDKKYDYTIAPIMEKREWDHHSASSEEDLLDFDF